MSVPDPNAPEKPKKDIQRDLLLKEIFDTEKTYNANLHYLQSMYIDELSKLGKTPKYKENKKVQALVQELNNITYIVGLSDILMKEIDLVVNEVGETTTDQRCEKIAQIFNKYALALKSYSNFIGSFNTILAQFMDIKAAEKENSPYNEILKNFKKKSNMLDVKDYLIMPVQRIPRYEMLLGNGGLLKHTASTDVSHINLSKAYETVKAVAAVVNESKRLRENKETEAALKVAYGAKDRKINKVAKSVEFELDTPFFKRSLVDQGKLLDSLSKEFPSTTNPARVVYKKPDLFVLVSIDDKIYPFKILKGKAGHANLSREKDKCFHVRIEHEDMLSLSEVQRGKLYDAAAKVGNVVVASMGIEPALVKKPKVKNPGAHLITKPAVESVLPSAAAKVSDTSRVEKRAGEEEIEDLEGTQAKKSKVSDGAVASTLASKLSEALETARISRTGSSQSQSESGEPALSVGTYKEPLVAQKLDLEQKARSVECKGKEYFYSRVEVINKSNVLKEILSKKYPEPEFKCSVRTFEKNGVPIGVRVTIEDKNAGKEMHFKVLKGKAGIENESHIKDKYFHVRFGKHGVTLSPQEHHMAKTIGKAVLESIGRDPERFTFSEPSVKVNDNGMHQYKQHIVGESSHVGVKRPRSDGSHDSGSASKMPRSH